MSTVRAQAHVQPSKTLQCSIGLLKSSRRSGNGAASRHALFSKNVGCTTQATFEEVFELHEAFCTETNQMVPLDDGKLNLVARVYVNDVTVEPKCVGVAEVLLTVGTSAEGLWLELKEEDTKGPEDQRGEGCCIQLSVLYVAQGEVQDGKEDPWGRISRLESALRQSNQENLRLREEGFLADYEDGGGASRQTGAAEGPAAPARDFSERPRQSLDEELKAMRAEGGRSNEVRRDMRISELEASRAQSCSEQQGLTVDLQRENESLKEQLKLKGQFNLNGGSQVSHVNFTFPHANFQPPA
ncbi:hypothetical protein GUITHDRAFT_100022 [Guillardia theta CCMP2712]|uniref:C2 NT-type domain-containing protein n=1 Tax=Guillardia theta (strain CCMP2712) TaxID=905079 RepID=L1K1Q4_GUITC|nr:hypothetical protein GUITHDRAFT_100022 [Guillardia theta CCMP2712]EKX54547.1 hypothetical protein GUITHDRAFT_100022 [Guillardia theta CCMP2712]|eukprot:XP_005841527.1 hypothetical protein GUITHDRAFT_100022 [Guillardia theta CCMP2712]